MTQKERVINFCKEHLESRNLTNWFDHATLEHIYKKRNGGQANAYTLGLTAADAMIFKQSKNLLNGTQHQ